MRFQAVANVLQVPERLALVEARTPEGDTSGRLHLRVADGRGEYGAYAAFCEPASKHHLSREGKRALLICRDSLPSPCMVVCSAVVS